MGNQTLFPPQKEVMEYGFLETGFHCLLNMATGSGKTYLAEYAIKRCIEKGFKAIYLTPLKALADEKYENWKSELTNTNIGIFTGDIINEPANKIPCSYDKAQLYIMTPERFDACLRNWRRHWHWIPDIDLLVVDELHLLSDPQRGPRLEGAITRLQRINPFARVLGLSATMPNAEEISDWLHGVHYASNWRQIPLEKRIARFNKPQEKYPILLNEAKKCIEKGGKSLIFANSRSRTQSVAEFLSENGINATYHHAGLNKEDRTKTEQAFRSGKISALVTTSTLEMGLNLPARQVIIFDSCVFNGTGFSPLPVSNFMQRAGRAGRPGLDSKGEVILIMPKWVGGADNYINEICEPIMSHLDKERSLAEQILVELFAGYSRTKDDLIKGFFPSTLSHQQKPDTNIASVLGKLITNNMVDLVNKEDTNGNVTVILKPTRLARLAVKQMFHPDTIRLIRDIYDKQNQPFFFDLLLMATLNDDCNPILPVNYEDTDFLIDIVEKAPSNLLDCSLADLQKTIELLPPTSRILSAIKMSAICYALTMDKNKEDLAQAFDIYETDIEMLKKNVVRLLEGISAILKIIDNPGSTQEDEKKEQKPEENSPSVICKALSAMIKHEIDSKGVILTRVPGVGGAIAKSLIHHGYTNIEQLQNIDPAKLSLIKGIGPKLAEKIIVGVNEIKVSNAKFTYTEEQRNIKLNRKEVKTKICPYRLRRSLELRIKGQEGELFYVTGGREDHIVTKQLFHYSCDCQDYQKRNEDCKHIIAVKYHLSDPEICKMIKKIRENKSASLRSALPSLWFSVAQSHHN